MNRLKTNELSRINSLQFAILFADQKSAIFTELENVEKRPRLVSNADENFTGETQEKHETAHVTRVCSYIKSFGDFQHRSLLDLSTFKTAAVL